MKAKNRDILLVEVLRTMYTINDVDRRYQLATIGESLVDEYRDLKKDEIAKRIEKIRDGKPTIEVTKVHGDPDPLKVSDETRKTIAALKERVAMEDAAKETK